MNHTSKTETDVVADQKRLWHSLTLASIDPHLKEADEIMFRLSGFERDEALAILELTRTRIACSDAKSAALKRVSDAVKLREKDLSRDRES